MKFPYPGAAEATRKGDIILNWADWIDFDGNRMLLLVSCRTENPDPSGSR